MYKMHTIGRNIIIETKDAGSGKLITTVINKATDTLVSSKVADNEQDALKDFDDMVTTHALPLQGRVHAARMKKGERYTLVTMSDFGLPVALNFTYHDEDYTAYAQYDDAATIYCFPKGARNLRKLRLHNQSFAIYNGWRVLSDDMIFNIDRKPNGVVTKAGKYGSFDERYIVDICDVWADFITLYQNVRPEPAKKQPEPMPDPDPATFQSHEVAPGITLMCDAEHGLYVDIAPETFEALYAPRPKDLSAGEILIRALRRATIACLAHANAEDGGTCNFDAPTLDYKTCGMTRDEAEKAIKAAGLHCYDWEKQLVITGPFSGQGNRRTKMAEAFRESMTEDGVAAGMYYQMD